MIKGFSINEEVPAQYIILAIALSLLIQSCEFSGNAGHEEKHIILITLDDLGNQIEDMGDSLARTPNLKAFSKESVLFSRAYVTQSSCSPSRASILTSLYPHQHGQLGLANGASDFRVRDRLVLLPNLLHENNFRTGVMGKIHINPSGLFRFDMASGGTIKTRDKNWVISKLDRFYIESKGNSFLMVNLFDPHVDSAKNFPKQIQNSPSVPRAGNQVAALTFQGIADQKQKERIADYYSAVERLDDIIGNIISFLKRKGIYDQSLIIIVSDNGPPFTRAKTSNYEAGVRVPMWVKPPEFHNGFVSEALVSTVDLMPTIIDYANIHGPDYLMGNTLRPLLEKRTRVIRDKVYTEFNHHSDSSLFPRRAIHTAKFKLIHNIDTTLKMRLRIIDGDESLNYISRPKYDETPYQKAYTRYLFPPTYELYDLIRDPDELVNLYENPAFGTLADSLKKELLTWRAFTSKPKVTYLENETSVAYRVFSDLYDSVSLLPRYDYKNFNLINQDEIYFINPPDFEKPIDTNQDNVYDLEIRLCENKASCLDFKISITVLDEGV